MRCNKTKLFIKSTRLLVLKNIYIYKKKRAQIIYIDLIKWSSSNYSTTTKKHWNTSPIFNQSEVFQRRTHKRDLDDRKLSGFTYHCHFKCCWTKLTSSLVDLPFKCLPEPTTLNMYLVDLPNAVNVCVTWERNK